MKDPIVGGYTPEKVALRRAIGARLRHRRRDQPAAQRHRDRGADAAAAGHPRLRPELQRRPAPTTRRRRRRCSTCSATSTATATAGASMPDGTPLVVRVRHRARRSSRGSSRSSGRRTWTRSASAWRWTSRSGPTTARSRSSASCRPGTSPGTATSPTARTSTSCSTAPTAARPTTAASSSPEFDRALREGRVDAARGAERPQIYQQMARLVAVYAPWKLNVHRKRNQFVQPWVLGWRKHQFIHEALPLRGHRPRSARQIPEMSPGLSPKNRYNSVILLELPALKPLRLLALPRRRLAGRLGAARRGAAEEGAAHGLPHRRNRLRPAADRRPLLGGHLREPLRGAAHLRLPRAPGEAGAAHRRGDSRAGGGRHALHLPHQARHLLRRRPGVQGRRSASWSRRTSSTRSSASAIRRTAAPTSGCSRTRSSASTSSPRRRRRPASSTTTRAIAGIEVRDKYTISFKLKEPDYNFLYVLAMPNVVPVAREVIEVYADDTHGPPGRHRPLRAQGVGAPLEDRAREEPEPPRLRARHALRRPRATNGTSAPSRRCAASACRCSTASRSIPIEDEQPRFLAFLNKEHDILDETPFAFIHQVLPNGKLAPASRSRACSVFREQQPEITYDVFNINHGRGQARSGRRLHAGEGGAAPRDGAGARPRRRRSSIVRKGQALPAQTPVPPGVVGYDADVPRAPRRTTTRQGQGAARHVRLRRPRRRRLARPARRQAARHLVQVQRRQPGERASSPSSGSKSMADVGIRIEATAVQFADLLQGQAAWATSRSRARRGSPTIPTRRTSCSCSTAPTPASPTRRASSSPNTTGSTRSR